MNFYETKSTELPRFLYRNLARSLEDPAIDRTATITNFYQQISSTKLKGDFLKLKYCLPKYLESCLTREEINYINPALDSRRRKRNERLLTVYPHCTDEFALDIKFLTAVLGATEPTPIISRETPIATIGSCFARNIAVYLKSKGYNINAFQLAEDLNSPFSNAKMLAICAAPIELQTEYVEYWATALYPEHVHNRIGEIVQKELTRLKNLRTFIQDSEVVVITCGNIIDYFSTIPALKFESAPFVAPKFFTISASEDLDARNYINGRLRSIGSVLRLANYSETVEALISQYNAIRTINEQANIVITLSPVPIDSAIGIDAVMGQSAVELDCISKSTLRAALSDFQRQTSGDRKLHYFPSFEIVRWIAPNVMAPVFGKEDAASRHVSAEVLAAVYRYFLHRFGAARNQ